MSEREYLESLGCTFHKMAPCRLCAADMEWWTTETGKWLPINPGTIDPHWNTCPDRQVVEGYSIRIYAKTIHIKCPFDEDLNAKFKEMGGRFCNQRAWILSGGFESEVRQALTDTFGSEANHHVPN